MYLKMAKKKENSNQFYKEQLASKKVTFHATIHKNRYEEFDNASKKVIPTKETKSPKFVEILKES